MGDANLDAGKTRNLASCRDWDEFHSVLHAPVRRDSDHHAASRHEVRQAVHPDVTHHLDVAYLGWMRMGCFPDADHGGEEPDAEHLEHHPTLPELPDAEPSLPRLWRLTLMLASEQVQESPRSALSRPQRMLQASLLTWELQLAVQA